MDGFTACPGKALPPNAARNKKTANPQRKPKKKKARILTRAFLH